MYRFSLPVILAAFVTTVPAAGQSTNPVAELPEILSSPTIVGTVNFPHKMHLNDMEIECAACHHETNATALSMPHAEYFEDFWIECQTCHRAGASPSSPQTCSACHHSSPTTTADETLSAKVVIHQNCAECHEGGTGQDASRSCGFCHEAPFAEAADEEVVAPEGGQHG